MLDPAYRFTNNKQGTLNQQVHAENHRACQGILNRHDAEPCRLFDHGIKYPLQMRTREQVGGRPQKVPRSDLAVCAATALEGGVVLWHARSIAQTTKPTAMLH